MISVVHPVRISDWAIQKQTMGIRRMPITMERGVMCLLCMSRMKIPLSYLFQDMSVKEWISMPKHILTHSANLNPSSSYAIG